MKVEKLPSGKYRIRVYLGEIDGKKKWKSITGDTKKEVMMKAASVNPAALSASKSILDIVKQYIELKRPVLSPTTQRTYTSTLNYFNDHEIGKLKSDKLTSRDVQAWISWLTVKVQPKTVRNAYALLTAAMAMYEPDIRFSAKLPQKKAPNLYTPSNDDVKVLIDYCQQKDQELLRCILLSSCCSLRRGEVAALTADDIDFNKGLISVTKARVKSAGSGWEIKPPKTDSSNRVVPAPSQVLDVLPKEGPIISITPDQITNRFVRAVNACGLHHFRYHDLRHYFATILAYNGVPARIIQDMGGWSTDAVMKRVYLGVIDEEKKRQQERINGMFEQTILKS